ncbi:hypothetical protein D3C72_663540 [compost metagenome]
MQDSVAAIIVDAGRQAVGQGVVIAASVRAVLEVRLDPVEVVLEDQVDDPGHRVGAIDRRGAARLDLHALNQRRRDIAEVKSQEVGIVRRARATATVHQGQGPTDAEVAQIGLVQADVAEAVAGVGVGQARRHLRHLIQDVRDIGDALGFDRLSGQRHGRRGRVQTAALQTRAGDHHLIDLRGLFGSRRRSVLGLGRHRRSQGAQADARDQGPLPPLPNRRRLFLHHTHKPVPPQGAILDVIYGIRYTNLV